MSKFQEGDVVSLKCGGMPMVVDSVKKVLCEDGESKPGVGCVWHDDSGKLHNRNFIDEILEKLK